MMKKIFLLFSVIFIDLNGCEIRNAIYGQLFSNDIKEVQEAITEGVNVNARDACFDDTALIIAAKHNAIEIAKLLIDSGADINAKNKNGYTALMLAVIFDRLEMVQLLVDSNADLDLQNAAGDTALLIAADFGLIKQVKILIEKGADLDIKNQDGNTALIIAVLRFVFNNNSRNCLELVKLLIDSGADLNIQNKSGFTALKQAELWLNDQLIELIKSRMEYLKNLKKIKLEFIHAAQEGEVKKLVRLIEQGVNINAQDENGFTALMRAAQTFIWDAPPYGEEIESELKRKLKIVKILLQKKADFTLKDNEMHWTALKWARESGNTQAEHLLKEVGATE